MSNPSRFPGDIYVQGTVICGGINLPNECVGNANINPIDPIYPQNLLMEHVKTFSQDRGSVAAAERKVMHVANGNGTLLQISCGVTVANIGAATITIDFYNNGVSILSAPITLNSTNTAYSSQLGAFATPNYSQFNVFEVVVTVSASGGTLGQGLWVQGVFQENTI